MTLTRRRFFELGRSVVIAGACSAVFPVRPSPAHTRALRTRTATPLDASALADIFNAHLAAAICPFPDRIEPWSAARAAEFLSLHNGTIIVERNKVPVGFGGLIDYANPATVSSIEPGVPPDIPVVALNVDVIEAEEILPILKLLVSRGCEELQRMGFESCRMRIPARTVLPKETWFRSFMVVDRAIKRRGVDEALEVVFDVPAIRESLAHEGF